MDDKLKTGHTQATDIKLYKANDKCAKEWIKENKKSIDILTESINSMIEIFMEHIEKKEIVCTKFIEDQEKYDYNDPEYPGDSWVWDIEERIKKYIIGQLE